MANAIHVIVPYRHASTWVFDDPRVGLSQEPFISGVPEMIDTIVANIPNASVLAVFSSSVGSRTVSVPRGSITPIELANY